MEELKKTSIDLSEIEIKDLNETVYKVDDLAKVIGNHLFTEARSIEMSDIAREMHKGLAVEVTQQELQSILEIVTSLVYYRPFAHLQILNYLNQKLINQ